ncbi:hypothetical protein BBO99_00002862 [Phytophthora kernoviae]|uniref:Piwi domain-containing protein n=1 Tax=Phytophthora kernoviae TaxID=325452 RepID=A0A3R7J3D5_9STRA|nr:hypothetical protein JM18_003138 [Phytophthora kernoviae]RLN14281.1 hypothetical protein BBI17_002777 [Phytophthora kernoviae]RLN82496.1 hypothetical protein BBO99_00002862 [Phytophthora kernoviae]
MKKTHKFKGGKELCWGYYQATTVFYAPGDLMALAMSALNVRSATDVQHLSERDMKNLAHTLRKVEVTPKHRKDRKRAIFGVSPGRADRTVVDIKGETMSVADYFMRRYNTPLRYPNLPLVNVGSKKVGRENWLPIELCEVAPGQRCSSINDLDTAEIIRQTNQPPYVRRENIINQVHQAGFENDPFLAAFGVKIGLQPEVTEACVLDPPEVQYANVSERPSGGQWNLKDKRFVTGATLRNWGVVVDANVGGNDVRHFIQNMVDMGPKSGLVLQPRSPPVIDRSACARGDVEEMMKTCFGEIKSRSNDPPQLIVVIKQDKGFSLYGRIKRISDTVLGVPSQCIVASNVRNTKPTFCANVCLKINMKLNGKNSILRELLPLVSSTPTIIIGADVLHPRSGIGSRPSIASVVASMDAFSAKYISRVAVQKASSDIMQLPRMLRELFMAFYQSTNRQPERVIYYRDGVSEGQFFDILQSEMRALRKAFKMLSDSYMPPRDADRKGNVVPGTVIDTGVVDPHRFDFFLYGHSGIQGTSVPCHYTVLHDENHMSADDLQRLTYHLGYTFSRCTRSVSFATPAYYAHLAAGRARLFLYEGSSDAASTMSANVLDSSSFDFAEVHKNLMDCMLYT